jgi:transposase
MKLYAAIDLHSNNSVVTVIDEQDRVVAEKRLPNELERIVLMLAAFRDALVGIVVESTFNWYWLVDGLMQAGFRVHLANTAAIQQYEGIKYTDDQHDARWLAHLLRLGILREGYVYPRESRGVRDLMRRRMQLVQSRTTQLLAIQTQLERSTGRGMNAEAIKRVLPAELAARVSDANVGSAMRANLAVLQVLTEQIERLEREILDQVRLAAQFAPLLSIPGIGKILGLAIMLETGEIGRFAKTGNFASYARCVQAKRISNGKQKAQGNAKCGNPYLAWAFVEAAHFAVRYNPRIRRFYQRKAARTNKIVAIKAVAHKLARACYHMLTLRQPFSVERCFA